MFKQEEFTKHMEGYLKEIGIENPDLTPMSLEEALDLYKYGFVLYEKKQYPEALALFQKLVVANPLQKPCWQAFAAGLQMSGEFQKAARAWAVLALLDIHDPYPHLYVTECYIALNDLEQAQKALDHLRTFPEALSDPVIAEKMEEFCL